LRQLRLVLAGAAVAAALLAALAATLLTRRALAPLARLSSAARAIEATGDPSRRLPDPATRDELAALAATLNGMLAALEQASERERRFVADASHELRTPLTALRGNAAYVARHGADEEALADLERDAERLARLLDDLLALAREDAAPAPSEAVDLAAVAREVAGGRERVEVVAEEPVHVRGDRAALARALANLVENGERYGPPGGRVRIELGAVDGTARVRVCDEGPGLAPAHAERAFERFWRGAPAGGDSGGGSGLGLAIVRATAERHGGRAAVDGEGRVVLELPALRDVSGSPDRTSGHPTEEPG
jgi:signal transduction histidine kinase